MADQQVDLFLDSLVGVPSKDDRALMEFPFFSLQKQPRMEPPVYDDGRTQIRIEPGPRGLATIWDKDVLLYVVSLLNEWIERGALVERTVRFSAHDLLRVTGRGTGKRSYELLLDALYRLRSTNIVTSIESADLKDRRGFGWIETWRVVERKTAAGRKVMAAIEITLNDWMFRALVKERRVLTINPAYFDLGGGLKRRVYELAHKHLGGQAVWKIGLEKLSRKVGTTRDLRRFKHDLLKVIVRDRIPDYQLSVEALADGTRPVVVIEPRPRCSEPSDPAGRHQQDGRPLGKPSKPRRRSPATPAPDLGDRDNVVEVLKTAKQIGGYAKLRGADIPVRVVKSRWHPSGLAERATLEDLAANKLVALVQHVSDRADFAKLTYSGEVPRTGRIRQEADEIVKELQRMKAIPARVAA